MTDESRTATPPPDWQSRASAYAEAYTAWVRAFVETAQPILDELAVQLSRIFGTHAHSLTTSACRGQRSYRRDLHRAYRRRYHQRPPLRRASQ